MTPRQVEDEIHEDRHEGDDAHVEFEPYADDVQVQSPMIVASPIALRRSSRRKQPSTRYPSDQYVLLTSEGEPESLKKQWMMIISKNGLRP